MATGTSAAAAGPVSSFDLRENQKRWVVIGICLNRVLLPVLRDFVGQEIPKHYASLKSARGIDTQVFVHFLPKDGPFKLNYGSINNNWGSFKKRVHLYDYKVNTAEDLAKLYLEPHMAKFAGFDNTCDLSAVLGILERASIFATHRPPPAPPRPSIQPSAKDVRSKVRNEWGHCNFDKWSDVEFNDCFQRMENLLLSLSLPSSDETKVLTDIRDWKAKGVDLCVGCAVDKDLMKLVNDQVADLILDVEVMKKTNIDEAQNISDALQNVRCEIDKRITQLENQMEQQQREQLERNEAISSGIEDLSNKVNKIEVRQDESEENIARLERHQKDLEASVASTVDALERKGADADSRVKALESSLEDHLNASANDVDFLAPRRNSCFCGREDELNAIVGILEGTRKSCVETAIYGLGGVGKTSLAVEFIWRHKNEYPGGVFWISGENNRVFQSSVREMALEMEITSLENDFSFTLTKALAWLKKQSQLWCLVVDNLDELEMSEDMRKLLRGKWKQGARGHVIITTRRESREIRKETGIEEQCCVELKCLTQEESVEFLRKQTEKMIGEDSEVNELARELAGLPLALDQAAAYIRYLSCSIKDYVAQYREQKVELLKKMKAQEPDDCTSPDRLAVHTTWLMNFEHITKSNCYKKELRVVATLVMEISAFLGPDDIPSEVFNEGLPQVDSPSLVEVIGSPLGWKEVMSLLTKLSLFQQFGANSYCVHRLVQEVIRSWMDEKRKEDAFCKEFFTKEFALTAGTRFLHRALLNTRSPVEVCEHFGEDAVFSVKNPPSLFLWGKLASHATYLLEYMLKFTTKNEKSACALLYTEETVRLLNEIAISYSVAREKVKAQEIQKRKLDFLTRLKEAPSKATLNVLLYFNIPLQDRFYKLISHCIRERPSNREDSNEAERMSNAKQLRQEGNKAVKREEYEKALSLYTRAIELNCQDYCLFSNRALCYLKLDKPQKALEDCDECLAIKPYYNKALQRKAWALDELLKGGRRDHLKGYATATAALAVHLATNESDKKVINEKFPSLRYVEIRNGTELEGALQNPQANKTLLLLEGEYNVNVFAVIYDRQFVGLGSGAVVNCKRVFVVQNCNCYLQNITFPRGNPPLLCQGQTTGIQMRQCQISAGFSSCQDYPECNGGQGCIATSRGKPICDRTNRFGIPGNSGVPGFPGVQVQNGSTVYIDHCQIHDCGGGGALVSDKGSRLFVRNCEVYKNHQAGLEARDGGELLACENKVYDNGTHGFLIGPETGRCSILNNNVFENHKEGILVANSKQKVMVDGNDIHHNMAFGLSLQCCDLSIANNKVFENGFWGIHCKSKTSANIKENEIFSNKCGGISIGINFSGKISIRTNVVRDHAGPWLLKPDEEGPFPDKTMVADSDPFFYLPPGETRYYSNPPTLENNQVFNNVEGLFHPEEAIERIQSVCCHCSKELCQKRLKRCPECYIAVYCGMECLEKHLLKHKSLCTVLKRRYSTTVEFLSLSPPSITGRIFGPHLKGIGKGPRPKKNSRQAFIVKVQTGMLNCHPKQLMRAYDQSVTVDYDIQSSDVFNMIMECGVLGQFNKFTSKKAFFWATFADGGKKLDIFLSHLAPYQQW